MKRITLKRKSTGIDIIDAIHDAKLFQPWFKDHETWCAWTAFLCALFALSMNQEQLSIYRDCTKRHHPPIEPSEEAWLVIGRRGGKSFVMALVAVFLACFRNYKPFLSPGERATVMVIAADRKQARIIIRYVRAFLTNIPMLKRMVERETMDGFELSNATTIEIHSSSFRSVRGYALAAALVDEIAFIPTDENSAEPDAEIINALRPGMASIPGSLLLCASSPYARRGELWRAYRHHHGQEHDEVLVWQAPTRRMNPTIAQKIIDRAMEKDEPRARAEYLAEFRSDIEAFISREMVEAVISQGIHERGFEPNITYHGFTDPSGGASDSFTLAIGHRDPNDGKVVLDVLREVAPRFDPDAVVREYAELLKGYGCMSVVGDRYAGEWPRSRFSAHGVKYEVAEKSKSMLYIDGMLPAINAKTIDLLDSPRLIHQLVGLERRTTRGTGREIVDTGPRQHDDVANVVAGLATILTVRKSNYDSSLAWVTNGEDEPYSLRLAKYQHAQSAFGGYLNRWR